LRSSLTRKRVQAVIATGSIEPSRRSSAVDAASGATRLRPAPSSSERSSASRESSATLCAEPCRRAVVRSGIEGGPPPTVPAIAEKVSLVIAPSTCPPEEVSL
jgi:hypothetical protein